MSSPQIYARNGFSVSHAEPQYDDGSDSSEESDGCGRRGQSTRVKRLQALQLARRDLHKNLLRSISSRLDAEGGALEQGATQRAEPTRLVRRVETYYGECDLYAAGISSRTTSSAQERTIYTVAQLSACPAAGGSPGAQRCQQARRVAVCVRFQGRVVFKLDHMITKKLARRRVSPPNAKRSAVHSATRDHTVQSIARTVARPIKQKFAKKVDLFS
eukprot:COSAG03_NODE_1920_length_3353_cov_7.316226_3_plen_216_part_00